MTRVRSAHAHESALYGSLAVRILLATVIGVFILLSRSANLYLVLVVFLAIVALDIRNILSLKNFVLTYLLLVFGVGGAVLHLSQPFIFRDIAAYLLVFLGGYALASIHRPGHVTSHISRASAPPQRLRGRGMLRVSSLENTLVLLVILDLIFLGFQFMKFGLLGYYKGYGLLDQALTYGKANSAGGAEQILRFGLKDSGIALVVLYVRACFESHAPIKYKYPIVLLVAIPIVSLSRFDAIVGALTALAIFACDSRLSAHRRISGEPRPDMGAQSHHNGPKMTRGVLIAAGMMLAIVTGLFIADLRSGFASKNATHPSSHRILPLLTSELSPVQAYGDIKANIGALGHPHGRTIVLPLVLKVIPRAWYPNKPLNSGAYYMSVVRPAEFSAGYALPPTYFGDAYLNFGFGGALLLSLALGLFAARLDLGYKQATLMRVPWFLFVFANFYALLRDPLSESLAGIVLMLLVWMTGNNVFRPRLANEQRRAPEA